MSQSSCEKSPAGAEREVLPITPAWREFIRQLISRKAKGFKERSKSYIGFTLGFCAKEFHLVTKKKFASNYKGNISRAKNATWKA